MKETKEESGSVHSLELRPTSHLGDCSGSDTHSVSSADGKSKSTDSLDQKGELQEANEEQVTKEGTSSAFCCSQKSSFLQPVHMGQMLGVLQCCSQKLGDLTLSF